METINFRLYGDQVYGLSSKFIAEYLTPEITKETFLENFKNGSLKYDNIKSKKKINISPEMSINDLSIQDIQMNIPDEKENFKIKLGNIIIKIELTDINENIIEQILINKRKNLVENFIDFAVKKIEKKQKEKTFIEKIIEKLINKAINDLFVEINNLELQIQYNNNIFIFSIEKFIYSEKDGTEIKNISLSFQKDSLKLSIIKKFSIIININYSTEESAPNKLDIKMTNFELELNRIICQKINNIINFFDNNQYKNVYLRYKKLIQYHSPKKCIATNNNQYYRLLWIYAIKTVIKLQKYISQDKINIFDLLNSIQNKITKKCLDNNSTDDFLLPNEINLLKVTKEKVEKKVIENKKGNALTNAFSFFFGGGAKEEKKDELTEEEKNISEEIYKENNIKKYLFESNNIDIEQIDQNPIATKIKKFFSNITLNINIEKLQLILINESGFGYGDEKFSFYIKGINLNLNFLYGKNYNYDFNFNIEDINIGTNKSESLFKERIPIYNNNNLLELKKDGDNKLTVLLGFKNIELNESLFLFLLKFIQSLKLKNKKKLFRETIYTLINSKEDTINNKDEHEINKNSEKQVNYNQIFNDFQINLIPSLTLTNKNNKIIFNIFDYSLSQTSISFVLNIKDSFGVILDNYKFIFNKDNNKINNKFILHFQKPLNILLSEETTKFSFISYLKFVKIKNKNKTNIQNIENTLANDLDYNEGELFWFNFKVNKNIGIEDLNLGDIELDFLISKLNIEINEHESKTIFSINNFNMTYIKKDMLIKCEEILLKTGLTSTIFLYLFGFRSPNYDTYEKIISNNKSEQPLNLFDSKEIYLNNNDNMNKKSEEKSNIIYEFNYVKLINDLMDSFNLNINQLKFIMYGNNNNNSFTSMNFNNINCYKKENNFYTVFDTSDFVLKQPAENNIKIYEFNQKTYYIIYPEKGLIKIKITSPIFNTTTKSARTLYDIYGYLFNQVDLDEVKCSFYIEIFTPVFNVNQFKYLADKFYIKNYSEKNVYNNTWYYKLIDFIMQNDKKINIVQEKLLNISYHFKSETENLIKIEFTEIDIKMSQSDITYLLYFSLAFFYGKENKNEVFLNNEIENIDLLNYSTTKEDNGGNYIKNHQKISKFFYDIKINKITLCFCLNDYSKCLEFSIKSTKFYLNLILSKNNNITDINTNGETDQSKVEYDYKIILGKVFFKYFDNDENEIIILKYEEEEKEEEDSIIGNKNKLGKEGGETLENQVEILYKLETYTVNINKNKIIVRLDSLLSMFYYFKNALPFDVIFKYLKRMDLTTQNMNIIVNFIESQFQLQTSFDGEENFLLDINEFTISYISSQDGKINNQDIVINLNFLSANIISGKSIRKLFNTKDNFLFIKLSINEMKIISNIRVNSIIINLSYRDIFSFLLAYLLNKSFFDKEYILSENKYLNNQVDYDKVYKSDSKNITTNENNINSNSNQDQYLFYGLMNLGEIKITLIDNSKGAYHPFLNINLPKSSLKLYSDKFLLEMNMILSSYNYISCVWEPAIEDCLVKLNGSFKKEEGILIENYETVIERLLINLSDMAISFTLISLNNWINKLTNEEKKYRDKLDQFINRNIVKFKSQESFGKKVSKIINNKVVNYTSMEMVIKYGTEIINCEPFKEVGLEYLNEWDIKKDGTRHITLIYNIEHKFNIPIDRLGARVHTINNEQYLVSENTLSEEREIDIFLYTPIVFNNMTSYQMKIILKNSDLGEKEISLLPYTIAGVPLSFYKKNTSFNIILLSPNVQKLNKSNKTNKETKQVFFLKDIMNTKINTIAKKYITINNVLLLIQVMQKIQNVRTIAIISEYSIINCLPFDIYMDLDDKSFKIKKCSQFFIDFNYGPDLSMQFRIEAGGENYLSKQKNYFTFDETLDDKEKDKGNYIKFKNSIKTKSFRLSYQYIKSSEKKIFIIYCNSLLQDKTSADLIISSNSRVSEFCFKITKNLYLFSSKLDIKDAYIKLKNNYFSSSKIYIKDIIEAFPYYDLVMEQESPYAQYEDLKLRFLIKKNLSYVPIENNPHFKENIFSMIYTILPICRITNLLSLKRFCICDAKDKKNRLELEPLSEAYFNFFYRGLSANLLFGISNLNETSCKYLFNYKYAGSDMYTLSTENSTFNLEIRGRGTDGIKEIFLVESTLNNAKIVVQNKTDAILSIIQKKYDMYNQIISPKEIEILKVYNKENMNFLFQLGVSHLEFDFGKYINEEKQENIKIDGENILLIETNGLKNKLTFYKIEDFFNLKTNSVNYVFKIIINDIFISMIGDNLNKNNNLLTDYQRNEIVLFFIRNLSCSLIIMEQRSEKIDKDKIEMVFLLEQFRIYNQVSEFGRFSKVFKNSEPPFLSFSNKIYFYKNGNVAKLKGLTCNINPIELNIDPGFIEEILNFFQNILYRMKISDFNVNEIFLSSKSKRNRPNQVLENYNKESITFYGKNIDLPLLNIEFELSGVGLGRLMKKNLGSSEFYVWLAKGLPGKKHHLNLIENKIEKYIGGINELLTLIFYNYKEGIVGEITNIGLKGLLGKISNFFSVNFEDKECKEVQRGRLRTPRIFYGKYKYFKSYDEVEAKLYRKIETSLGLTGGGYFFSDLLIGNNFLYVFTSLTLFILNKNIKLIHTIEYFDVLDANSSDKKLVIKYNQVINGKNNFVFLCENEETAKNAAIYLNNEIAKSTHNFIDI